MLVTWTLNKPSEFSVAVTRLADFATDIRQIITSFRMEITRLHCWSSKLWQTVILLRLLLGSMEVPAYRRSINYQNKTLYL